MKSFHRAALGLLALLCASSASAALAAPVVDAPLIPIPPYAAVFGAAGGVATYVTEATPFPINCVLGCSGSAVSIAAFGPTSGNVPLTATTTSSRAAFGSADPTGWITNTGSVVIYFKLGSSTVIATTSDVPLQPGMAVAVNRAGSTHIAAITASGSSAMTAVSGTGLPAFGAPAGSGGGGGGGAVTIADGSDVATGSLVDPAWSGTGNGTAIAVAKYAAAKAEATRALLAAFTGTAGGTTYINVVNRDPTTGAALDVNAPTPAGTNIIGKVGIDQATPGTTNGVVVNSSALPAGAATAANQTSVIGTRAAGTAAANSLLVGGVYSSTPPTLANGQQAAFQFSAAGALIVSGAGGGTQYAEDAAHASGDLGTVALGVRKDAATALAGADGDYTASIYDGSGRLWVNVGADAVQGTTSDTSSSNSIFGALLAIRAAANDTTTPTPSNLAAATTGGCTPYGLASAASANSTSMKGSAGTLCSLSLTNETATKYYFRAYDLAAAPTCSSATGYKLSIMVPANTAGAGIVVNTGPFGWAFPTGIAFCITAGAASTDNTSAATGVGVIASFK